MSGALVITGATALLPGGPTPGSRLVAVDGRIVEVGVASPARADGSGSTRVSTGGVDVADARRVDGNGLLLAPGLIELQLNGGFGHDFTGEPASVWQVGERLGSFGVTAFLPTLVSPALEAVERAASALNDAPAGYAGATPLGWHVEGPFIAPERSGAHDPSRLLAPSIDAVAGWSPAAGIRMVTIAPELRGAMDVIGALVGRGVVVAAGHSSASGEQAREAFDAGVRYATHLFNAMAPLRARDSGLAAAALDDPRVTVGVIPDGVHVDATLVRLAYRAAGLARFSAVTDATAALGMPAGTYRLGERDVFLDDGAVRTAEGRLAGSALAPDEALRRLARIVGLEPWQAVAAMTHVPSALLGISSERGVLCVGGRADLVLFDADLHPVKTFVGGEEISAT